MKILSIPYVYGGASHLIPLMVLHHNYIRKTSETNNSFLVDEDIHPLLKSLRMKALPINYSTSKVPVEEMMANLEYFDKKVKDIESQAVEYLTPDVILEDLCYNAAEISEKYSVPRISIQRTGIFRHLPEEKRNPKHFHSIEKGSNNNFDIKQSAHTQSSGSLFSTCVNKFENADAKIIPGIPSIEVLPESVSNKKSYFYSGPLLLKVSPSDTVRKDLASFLQRNKNKKKVYITTGLVDKSNINTYITFLLKRGYAIITNHSIEDFASDSSALYSKKMLPLNFVCSKVDLVIHHCGSGMYHYPILNEKPAITIGTQCFDREDVAIRLQDLGVSKHTPHPDDNEDFLSIFEENIDHFENGTLTDFNKLQELKEEIELTRKAFKFGEVIDYVVNNQKSLN